VRRHEIDVASLVSGLLFLIVASVHISARATGTDLNLRWLLPATLVLLGALGLLSALRPSRGTASEPAEPPERVDVPVTDEAVEASTEE
jgi:hypothetical protein